jgi:2-polyprenyl-3-methyl-5-hydroxy-6-metoxy-1,4-benzoquinol methylase
MPSSRTIRRVTTSPDTTGRVREHFRKKAFSFDHLYDEEHALQRLLRPGLFNRRELALEIARRYDKPSVLDVGGGSGRIGEPILEQGASRYVDVDLSNTMLDLARERLARFGDKVELVQGDFLSVALDGPFDVVLALGYFDYIAEAEAHVRRIGELCAGSVVASFPRWTWTKGPVRKLRYEVINNCPIFDYSAEQLRRMFAEAGFAQSELRDGKSGYLLVATKARGTAGSP